MAYGNCDGPVVQRQLEIPAALAVLEGALGDLEDYAHSLSARLEPLKGPLAPPTGEVGANKLQACPVAEQINAKTQRIRTVVVLIQDNLSRLEI